MGKLQRSCTRVWWRAATTSAGAPAAAGIQKPPNTVGQVNEQNATRDCRQQRTSDQSATQGTWNAHATLSHDVGQPGKHEEATRTPIKAERAPLAQVLQKSVKDFLQLKSQERTEASTRVMMNGLKLSPRSCSRILNTFGCTNNQHAKSTFAPNGDMFGRASKTRW